MVVSLSAHVIAHFSARRELMQALLDWAASVRREPAAVAASVAEDVMAAGTFELLAAWQSTAGLEAHCRSEPFGVLLGSLELLAEPVRLTVNAPNAEYGDDALAALRRLRGTPHGSAA